MKGEFSQRWDRVRRIFPYSTLTVAVLLSFLMNSASAQQTFSVCIGEGPIWGDGSGCPPKLDGYFPCEFAYQHAGDTDSAAAEQFCRQKGHSRKDSQRIRSYNGHKCGYIVISVTCKE
jgi:hypothetical protein